MHPTEAFDENNYHVSDPENYFHIRYHVHNLYVLPRDSMGLAREYQEFQLTFPKRDLFSPEYGPAIVKCFLLRHGLVPAGRSLDELTLYVLYLARQTAAVNRHLQLDMIVASSFSVVAAINGELFRAVKEWKVPRMAFQNMLEQLAIPYAYYFGN